MRKWISVLGLCGAVSALFTQAASPVSILPLNLETATVRVAPSPLPQEQSHALSTHRLPVLVYLQLPTGPHFSLLTGLAGHHVALADPQQGRLIWPCEDFQSAWAPRGEGYLLSLREDPAG